MQESILRRVGQQVLSALMPAWYHSSNKNCSTPQPAAFEPRSMKESSDTEPDHIRVEVKFGLNKTVDIVIISLTLFGNNSCLK